MKKSLITTQSALLPNQIEAAIRDYTRLAEEAFSPNTERAWRSDTRIWADWCANNDRRSLPALPADVADFLKAQAETKAIATVRRYCSSVGRLHRAATAPDPTAHDAVRLALRRIARAKGTRPGQATGLTRSAVDRMLGATGESRQDRRDAALLAVAYDTMARRSELVAMDIEDLAFDDDGSATVLIRRSKADQEGEGRVAFLAPDTARTLRAWLQGAGIDEGPIFRRVRRGGHPGTRLDSGSVSAIFRRLAERADVDPAGVSGHSTRIGAAQDQVAAGIELGAVMQAGGWRSPTMVARYSERLLAGRSGAAQLARAQGRA